MEKAMYSEGYQAREREIRGWVGGCRFCRLYLVYVCVCVCGECARDVDRVR